MRVVYAIRHQSAGVLLDKLYVEKPSAEDIERIRLAHSVPGHECWARVVHVPIEVPGKLAEHFDEAPAPAPLDVAAEPRAMPRLALKATATVKNPR